MGPITIILSQGYSDWEIAPLAGAGRSFFGADIRFASPLGGPLVSSAGLAISDTDRFVAPAAGVVVVCGGSGWEVDAPPDVGEELRRALSNGCVVAGICGGTIALARAGLLDDAAHTSSGPDYLAGFAPNYAGASKYVDQPYAFRDRSIITAPAPAPGSFATQVLAAAGLPIDAAAQIEDLLSREHARRLA